MTPAIYKAFINMSNLDTLPPLTNLDILDKLKFAKNVVRCHVFVATLAKAPVTRNLSPVT